MPKIDWTFDTNPTLKKRRLSYLPNLLHVQRYKFLSPNLPPNRFGHHHLPRLRLLPRPPPLVRLVKRRRWRRGEHRQRRRDRPGEREHGLDRLVQTARRHEMLMLHLLALAANILVMPLLIMRHKNPPGATTQPTMRTPDNPIILIMTPFHVGLKDRVVGGGEVAAGCGEASQGLPGVESHVLYHEWLAGGGVAAHRAGIGVEGAALLQRVLMEELLVKAEGGRIGEVAAAVEALGAAGTRGSFFGGCWKGRGLFII